MVNKARNPVTAMKGLEYLIVVDLPSPMVQLSTYLSGRKPTSALSASSTTAIRVRSTTTRYSSPSIVATVSQVSSTMCARMVRSTSPSNRRVVSTPSTLPRCCCATSTRTMAIVIWAINRQPNSSTTVSKCRRRPIRKPSATSTNVASSPSPMMASD